MKRIVIGLLGAWLAAGAQKLDEAEKLFKSAQNLELVDGNLKAAIEQYGKVARSGNRALAAQALYKMGECQEKLGQAEARRSFERVVKEFGDQGEVVARARMKLAVGAVAEQGMRIRQLGPAGPGCMPQVLGAMLADCYRPEGIFVRNLRTGEEKLVVLQANRKGRFLPGSMSPDEKTLTYFEAGSGLHAVDADGSNDRFLANLGFGSGSVPLLYGVWTRDGKRLLLALRLDKSDNQRFELAYVTVADGRKTVLRTLEGFRIADVILSPDEKYAAVKPAGVEHRSILIVPLAGGAAAPLEGTGAALRLVGWHPSGRVLYTSDQVGGQVGVWAIGVENGKSTGEPALVHAGIHPRVRPWVGRDGALHIDDWGGREKILSAVLDLPSGTLAAPRAANKLFTNGLWSPSYSPDGKSMVYATAYAPGTVKFVIKDLASGTETAYPVPLRTVGRVIWHPDGESLIAIASTSGSNDWKVYRFLPSTGGTEVVVDNVAWVSERCRDDIFYVKQEEKASVMRRNLRTGATSVVNLAVRADQTTDFAASPTGSQSAFVYLAGADSANPGAEVVRLVITRAAGGPERTLFEAPRIRQRGQLGFAWTPDGRSLLYSTPGAGEGSELWIVDATGGAPRRLYSGDERIGSIAIHPNGKDVSLAIYGGSEGRFLVIENPFAARQQ